MILRQTTDWQQVAGVYHIRGRLGGGILSVAVGIG
jgi:hypothetical protein